MLGIFVNNMFSNQVYTKENCLSISTASLALIWWPQTKGKNIHKRQQKRTMAPVHDFWIAKGKNPAYRRHQISRLMQIVGPIQILRCCMIYLEKEREKKNWAVDEFTRPRDSSTRPRNGSTRGQWTLCTHPSFLGFHAWAMDALHPTLVFRAPCM